MNDGEPRTAFERLKFASLDLYTKVYCKLHGLQWNPEEREFVGKTPIISGIGVQNNIFLSPVTHSGSNKKGFLLESTDLVKTDETERFIYLRKRQMNF